MSAGPLSPAEPALEPEPPKTEAHATEGPVEELPPVGRWRRFAPLVLVAGALAAGTFLVPKLPHEREIDLKVADPATIVAVEMSWSFAADPIHGGSWHFAPGRAPATLSSKATLPDGRYEVDISVQRTEGPFETTHRSIDLEKVNHLTLRVP